MRAARVPVRLLAAGGLLIVAVPFLAPSPLVAQDVVDGHHQSFGDATGFRNLLPPGQDGVLNGFEQLRWQGGERLPYIDDQLEMYADILQASPGLTVEDLDVYFKDASFGVRPDDIGRVYRPAGRDDVLIIRDASHGVPHIFGDTREGTFFAKGYATAEDRLFLMDILRHAGRARLSEFLGATEFNIATDRAQLFVAPYTEDDLTFQTIPREDLPDPELGKKIRADADAYLAGVNAYVAEARLDPNKLPAEYPALQKIPEDFVVEDAVAIASLVGGIFGAGGGHELTNFCAIQELADEVGPDEARAIFDDLKMGNDPEAPTTTTTSFPYMGPETLGPVDPAAIPPIDCATLTPIGEDTPAPDDVIDAIESLLPEVGLAADGPFGPIPLTGPRDASNAVLVNGNLTDTGAPIAVFGPQVAYFAPQLLVEADVHGPDIDARGVAFPGIDVYTQLGRGPGYAWSATTSRADAKDTFVLVLCEPGGGEPTVESLGHLHEGECVPIETWNHTQLAVPTAASGPDNPPQAIVLSWRVDRSPVYGPLIARGRLMDGTPIGVATFRSTYFRETLSAAAFHNMNSVSFMERGVEAFREAMGDGNEFSFNWFYVDDEHIAYQSSCRCPRRSPGVDPYLPTWGTGEYDWTEFLSRDEKPWDVDPERGYLVSWNNGQAPDFWNDDDHFSRGPVDRSDLLERRLVPLVEKGGVELTDVVDLVMEGATTDLRGQESLPLLRQVMGASPPSGLDPRVKDVWDRLVAWADDRMGHRRDRDGDGAYEHAVAIAVMDAWWPNVVTAVFDDLFERFEAEINDPPQLHLGSAWNTGAWGQLDKDLRGVVGLEVEAPFHHGYCGDGDLEACRDALWESLEDTLADLEAEFESSNVADWQRTWEDDAIVHTAAGINAVDDIHWQNRPTFHQVVQLPASKDDGTVEPSSPLPATGGGAAAVFLFALVGLGAVRSTRRPSLVRKAD